MLLTLSPNPAKGQKQRLRIQSPTSPFFLGSNNDQLEPIQKRNNDVVAANDGPMMSLINKRLREKFCFSFDWENTEDTSLDMSSLYQNPHEAQLLFGRGFRAGMDRREQKKVAVKNETDMLGPPRAEEARRE